MRTHLGFYVTIEHPLARHGHLYRFNQVGGDTHVTEHVGSCGRDVYLGRLLHFGFAGGAL